MMPARVKGNKGKGRPGATRRAHALRILVVENHSDTRQGINAFLKALGHQAAFAEDKAGAVSRARRATFDLLLSDISLPDGTGWELLQTLDAQGRRPAHAIAMSGLGDPADQTRSLEAGFELHLVKPFRPQDLETALRRVADSPARPGSESSVGTPASRGATRAKLRKRLHDGLAQHLAAATLLQGALTNCLDTLSTSAATVDLAVRLKETVADSRQIGRLLDEALEETLSLLRSA